MRILLRWLAALLLLGGALWQGEFLFREWQTIPRQDFNAWRIEFATMNLDQPKQTQLEFQTRVEKTTDFKKIALPHLELILTDEADRTVATINLKPQEWMPANLIQDNQLLLLGIAPGSEITSSIPLEIPEQAAGYRIRFFYPTF